MNMRSENMSTRVRAAFQQLSPDGEEVTLNQLRTFLGISSGDNRRPLYSAVQYLLSRKEIERLKSRVYVTVSADHNRRKPDLKTAMWAVLRMKRVVTINDMQELAEAPREYVKEFMDMLTRRGCVEKITQSGRLVYRLIEDSGPETPTAVPNIEKSEHILKSKEQALAEIDRAGKMLMAASQSLVSARILINDINARLTEEDKFAVIVNDINARLAEANKAAVNEIKGGES